VTIFVFLFVCKLEATCCGKKAMAIGSSSVIVATQLTQRLKKSLRKSK
jgi:hypothetical protein